MKPNLYIIAGCNGAGKTTAAFHILQEYLDCREFVNADSIAWALSPFQPESVAFEAGRIMLKRINELIEKQVDFALETTLSSKTYRQLIRKAQERNYRVNLLFFWLPSPEFAFERVCKRFANGGHFIPEEVVHRRYERGLRNLFEFYLDDCDQVSVYDNSSFSRELIATKKYPQGLEVMNRWKMDRMKEALQEAESIYLDSTSLKIHEALEHHYRKLIETTIRDNSYLLVADKNGGTKRVYADELKQLNPNLVR